MVEKTNRDDENEELRKKLEKSEQSRESLPLDASKGSVDGQEGGAGYDPSAEAEGASGEVVTSGIEEKAVESTMENYFLRYSMSVIIDRRTPR